MRKTEILYRFCLKICGFTLLLEPEPEISNQTDIKHAPSVFEDQTERSVKLGTKPADIKFKETSGFRGKNAFIPV